LDHGQSSAIIFTPEDRASGKPEKELEKALTTGWANDERWHIRKDGSRFFASGAIMRERASLSGGRLRFNPRPDRARQSSCASPSV
jgi:hypothetical protein